MTRAKPAGRSDFHRSVDDAFYADVRRENGGQLPTDLVGKDGCPRKLTESPADRAYRRKWLAVAAGMRHSKAVPKKLVKSPCAPCAAANSVPPKTVTLPGKGGKPLKVGRVTSGHLSNGTSAAAAKAPPPPATTCKNEALEVACGHGGRHYQLQLPAANGRRSAEFEVIDDGEETITCMTRTAGPCDGHKGKVFDLNPIAIIQCQSDTELKFQPVRDLKLRNASFLDLFALQATRTPDVYEVCTDTCQQENGLSAIINVYPQLDWQVNFALKYSKPSSEDGDKSGDGDESGWSLSGPNDSLVPILTAIVLGKSRVFGKEIIGDLKRILDLLDLACKIADFIAGMEKSLGSNSPGKLEVKYPELALAGTWGWVEIPNQPQCGYQLGLDVSASPLIGVSGTVEVLAAVIDAVPAVGEAINFIRSLLKSVVDVEINLGASGTIGGAFHFKEPLGGSPDVSGKLDGTVSFTAEALARAGDSCSIPTFSVTWHWYGPDVHKTGSDTVGLGVGAKVGGDGGIHADIGAGHDGEGFYWQGEIRFDGIDVYAVTATVVGVETGSQPAEDRDSGGISDTTVEGAIDTSDLPGEVRYEHVWHWFAPKTWWGSDERHPLFRK